MVLFKPSYSTNYSVRITRKTFRPEFDVVSDQTGETFQSATLFAYHAVAVRRSLNTIPSIFSDANTLALILSIRDGLREIGFKAVQVATGVIGYYGIALGLRFKIRGMRYWQLSLIAFNFPGRQSHFDIRGNSLSMRFADRIVRIASEARTIVVLGKQLIGLITDDKFFENATCDVKVENRFISHSNGELCVKEWPISDRKMTLSVEKVSKETVLNIRADSSEATIHPFISVPLSLRINGQFLPLTRLLSKSFQTQISAIIRCYIPPALRLFDSFNGSLGWTVVMDTTFSCASLIFGGVFTVHALIRPFPSTVLLIPHTGPTALLRMNLKEFSTPAEMSRPNAHVSHVLLTSSNIAEFKKRTMDAFKLFQLLRLAMPAAAIEYAQNAAGDGIVRLTSARGKMVCTVSHISVTLAMPEYPEVAATFAQLEGKQPVQVHLALLRMMTRCSVTPFFPNLVALIGLISSESIRWDVLIKGAKLNENSAVLKVMSQENGKSALIVVRADAFASADEGRSMPLTSLRPQLERSTQRIDLLARLFPDTS